MNLAAPAPAPGSPDTSGALPRHPEPARREPNEAAAEELSLLGALLQFRWLDPREAPGFFNCVLTLLIVAVVAASLLLVAATARAAVDDVPIGGFQPWVVMGLTDEFQTVDQDLFYFQADLDTSYNPSRALTPASPVTGPYYAPALVDSGAQISVITAADKATWDLAGNGFVTGANTLPVIGVAGTVEFPIEDPLGVFVTGFQNATPANGATGITVDDATMRGQTSYSVASATPNAGLPNILGLPTVSQFNTVIRNSQPQFFEHAGRNFRSPSVTFELPGTLPPDVGVPGGIQRRTDLELQPAGAGAPPFYFPDLSGGIGVDLHDNPSQPTATAGAFFVETSLTNDGTTRTVDAFFDTGAQVTVVKETFAAQLGFDVVLDEPDFVVPIQGVGGTLGEAPGFFADQLEIASVGGNFVATNVPVVVIDAPDPLNPLGANVDMILGTNAFWDRDLVLDRGDNKLWISDSVVEEHVWSPGVGVVEDFLDPSHWTPAGVPNELWHAKIIGDTPGGPLASAGLSADATVYRLLVDGNDPGTPDSNDPITLYLGDFDNSPGSSTELPAHLRVYTTIDIVRNGVLQIFTPNSSLSAQRVNVIDGGQLHTRGDVTADLDVRDGTLFVAADTELTGSLALSDASVTAFRVSPLDGPSGLSSDLDVTGSASLNGELALDRLAREIALGHVDLLLEADALAGVFATVTGIDAGDGLAFAVTYTDTQVLASVALFGDANLNQLVEQGDLNAVLNNWGKTAADDGISWVTGDLNGNGIVEQGDLNAVLNHWGDAAAPDFTGFTVPEPASLLGIGLMGWVLSSRTSSRRSL